MVDIVDKKTRSRMMAGIRSSDTRPEKLVRSYLHCRGFRFARSSLGLVGKPDIILPRWRVVVFVHGCFWHMHGCNLSKVPENNHDFWEKKLKANSLRDQRVEGELMDQGWRILTIWECATRGEKHLKQLRNLMDEVAVWIRQTSIVAICYLDSTGLNYSNKNDITHN